MTIEWRALLRNLYSRLDPWREAAIGGLADRQGSSATTIFLGPRQEVRALRGRSLRTRFRAGMM
jgi:hypothetical protein